MSQQILLPPLERFTGAMCRRARLRWWIRPPTLASRAGCGLISLDQFEKGRLPAAKFDARGAVHDAMHDLIEEAVLWSLAEIRRLQGARNG